MLNEIEDLDRRRDHEEGVITDEKVERLRRRVGLPVPYTDASFEFAGVDSLRNYARGIGDVDPFYRDPRYARRTPWGGFAAQPTFMLYMGISEETELSEELLATGRGDPLAGVHAFYSAEEMRWFRRIDENDRLSLRKGLASVEVKSSRMGGQAVHEVHEGVYRNQDGSLVGLRRQLLVRVGRASARSQGKNLNLDVPHRYNEQEMAAIEAEYEREYVRGSEPRLWEDVAVGEESVPLLRGPYTTTAYICYAEATGPRNDYHRAHTVAYRYRKEHPRAFPLNPLGYPDTIARVHWDREMAQRAGLPETYDFGGERVAWFSTAATHWMGDTAFLCRLQIRLRGFCFVGDTVWIRGVVTDKRVEGEDHLVDLELTAINQRSETISTGSATFLLPVRGDTQPRLPMMPGREVSIFA